LTTALGGRALEGLPLEVGFDPDGAPPDAPGAVDGSAGVGAVVGVGDLVGPAESPELGCVATPATGGLVTDGP
jgi:hypothetical protein